MKQKTDQKNLQPNKSKVQNFSSLEDYEKSTKKLTNNTIQRLEIECVMEQIKKLEKLGIFIKM